MGSVEEKKRKERLSMGENWLEKGHLITVDMMTNETS